jgi:hypothetical protein
MVRAFVWDSGDRWDDPDLVWDGPETPVGSSMDNQISEELPDAVVAQILQKYAEIRALMPFLRNIPAGQKRKFSGIAKERAGLDEVCIRLMQQHPELIPPGVSLAEVQKDVALRKALKDVKSPAVELVEILNDTELIGATDSMKAYRWLYEGVKAAAKHDVPGADAAVEELAPFFDTSGEPDDEAPPPAPGG